MEGFATWQVLAILVAGLGVLPVVVLVRGLFFECRQLEVTPLAAFKVDGTTAAERLGEAIQFKTISHQDPGGLNPQAFQDLHRFLERAFPKVHHSLSREVINEHSLLYTWKGTDGKSKPILLMAHMDVVPVDPGTEGEWVQPPFSGRIADGYIWGRGSMDLKVSVLGSLEAVELLLSQGFQPTRTIYLAFGHDEEIGGQQGAMKIASLLKSRGVRLEYVLDEGLPVGHGLIPGVPVPVAMIGIAEKGYLTIELSVAGTGGHASMPPPHTAIGTLSAAIQRLESNPMPAAITEPIRQMFSCVGPEMSFTRRMILANLWLFEPLVNRQLAASPATNALLRTTAAVTMVQGGTKENVLPAEAKAIVNFRVLPGNTVASVTAHVRRVIDDPAVTIRTLNEIEPSPVTPTDSETFRTLTKTIRQVIPDVVVAPSLLVAGTDSKHYLPLTDATYRFLPIRLTGEDLQRIHGTNERIAIKHYAEIISFYVQLIRNSASVELLEPRSFN